MQHRAAGGRALAGRAAGESDQGAADPCLARPGTPRRRRDRQHSHRLPPRLGRGPGRHFRRPALRRRGYGALAGRGPRGGACARRGGLALWGGGRGSGGGAIHADAIPDGPVSALRAERAPTYRSLMRVRALALARLGRRAEAVEPLTTLVRELPRDEEVLLELLRSEAATAGPSAALATYDSYRRTLRDELGTDPGPALQAVHQELLQGEAPAVRRGVPHEPNPLLGRDADIAAVAELLRTSRVTSIVGAGGLGKTRLAHVVSREAEQRVVHMVALVGLTSDGDVVGEVASVLGVGESLRTPVSHFAIPTDVLTGIVGALGPGPALLVLDNCEHVIRGVAELVHALVSMTRDLRVLTTSRAPLGISSESVYSLPELNLPTTVELFEQRARAARPGVELPAETVAELCRHPDGLPLAAELAAARVRVMSVGEIARRLQDRFALLRGGARDAPQRHRTLHAVVDWSWNLLDPAGRAALRALSVFPSGFTADAAQQLLGADESSGGLPGELPAGLAVGLPGGSDVLQVLEDLVDQSLLKVTDTASGTRFAMLETVREFSTARRAEAGEDDRVTGQFMAWARDFGAAHHDALFGPDPFASWEGIRAEQDNLVQALRLGLARGDGATVAATTAVLGTLWTTEANYTRLVPLTEDTGPLLSHFRPGPDLVEVTRTAAVMCTANGLRLWRRAVDQVKNSAGPVFGAELDLEPWSLEVQAVAVTAHARHGRLDLLEEIHGVLQAGQAHDAADAAGRHAVGVSGGRTGLRCAAARARRGRPRPGLAHRRRTPYQVRGRGSSPWRNGSAICATSSRPCPPHGPGRRPNRPTGPGGTAVRRAGGAAGAGPALRRVEPDP
ncbi:hypothetical protein NLX86_15320 [Streptomyces sp. A3M-1-3]|uniref:ATP-binding protein n=1 Tax=Streptomyces sp. A3M-1-3 TaxID=2962044 RepID=UPI0020B89B77|nr:BTAD domain-containing putative transcriptional regulator [Streptomyces sp. A3M-1-3]MCP3819426.1 hypothetical protein [Streptomyces sp. A3M-1-3]